MSPENISLCLNERLDTVLFILNPKEHLRSLTDLGILLRLFESVRGYPDHFCKMIGKKICEEVLPEVLKAITSFRVGYDLREKLLPLFELVPLVTPSYCLMMDTLERLAQVEIGALTSSSLDPVKTMAMAREFPPNAKYNLVMKLSSLPDPEKSLPSAVG